MPESKLEEARDLDYVPDSTGLAKCERRKRVVFGLTEIECAAHVYCRWLRSETDATAVT